MKKIIIFWIAILAILFISIVSAIDFISKEPLTKERITETLKEIFKQDNPKDNDFKVVKNYMEDCKEKFTFKDKDNCTTHPRIDYEYKGQKGILLGVT